MSAPPLISAGMLRYNRTLHAAGDFGGSGWKRAEDALEFALALKAGSVLDYGSGEGTLRMRLTRGHKKRKIEGLGWTGKVYEYDPAVPRKETARRADLVVCTDVLEHVEPKMLFNVLAHIRSLASRGIYLNIATRKSNKTLPDGRNAHLIIKSLKWWVRTVRKSGMRVANVVETRRKNDHGPHSVTIKVRI